MSRRSELLMTYAEPGTSERIQLHERTKHRAHEIAALESHQGWHHVVEILRKAKEDDEQTLLHKTTNMDQIFALRKRLELIDMLIDMPSAAIREEAELDAKIRELTGGTDVDDGQ